MLGTFSTYALVLAVFECCLPNCTKIISKSCLWALFATLLLKMFINPRLDDV